MPAPADPAPPQSVELQSQAALDAIAEFARRDTVLDPSLARAEQQRHARALAGSSPSVAIVGALHKPACGSFWEPTWSCPATAFTASSNRRLRPG
jgi:hypothetical protein